MVPQPKEVGLGLPALLDRLQRSEAARFRRLSSLHTKIDNMSFSLSLFPSNTSNRMEICNWQDGGGGVFFFGNTVN